MQSKAQFRPAARTRHTMADRVAYMSQCVADDACTAAPVPHAPVALCGYHMRCVYQFAADFISVRQDDAVQAALNA